MSAMPRTEVCDLCSREYLKENMKKTSSKPRWLCLRCVNRGSGLRSQGRRAQAVATLQSSGYIINEPGLKAEPINWFREQGTRFKVHT